MNQPLQVQVNAQRFASTPEASADAIRHDATRRSSALLHTGHRGAAQFVMARAIERQARILGCGHVEIPACQICGVQPCAHATAGGAA